MMKEEWSTGHVSKGRWIEWLMSLKSLISFKMGVGLKQYNGFKVMKVGCTSKGSQKRVSSVKIVAID